VLHRHFGTIKATFSPVKVAIEPLKQPSWDLAPKAVGFAVG